MLQLLALYTSRQQEDHELHQRIEGLRTRSN